MRGWFFKNKHTYWNTVDPLTLSHIRTIHVMNFIFGSLSTKYRQLQKEVDQLKMTRLVSEDEHDNLTKLYEGTTAEEARLLLTGR